jgi:hypothetical protein
VPRRRSGGRNASESSLRQSDPVAEGTVSLHVDLVVNDFHAGVQRLLAVLHDGGVEVKVELVSDGEDFDLPSQVWSAPLGRFVTAHEATAFLQALGSDDRGSAYYATELHDIADCPFQDGTWLEFGAPRVVSAPGARV